jgi:energy-converting hydrogenase B subunit D
VTAAIQATALVLLALGGTAVVLQRDPTRQAVLTGLYGLVLAVLFLLFQAPDVALSAIVVGAVALPAMILFTLLRLKEED